MRGILPGREGKKDILGKKVVFAKARGKDCTTCPFKKLSLSVNLGCCEQRGGCPWRQRADSQRGLDSILKAMGTQ